MKYLLSVLGCLLLMSGCGRNGQEPASVQNLPVLPVDTLKAVLEIGVELGGAHCSELHHAFPGCLPGIRNQNQ